LGRCALFEEVADAFEPVADVVVGESVAEEEERRAGCRGFEQGSDRGIVATSGIVERREDHGFRQGGVAVEFDRASVGGTGLLPVDNIAPAEVVEKVIVVGGDDRAEWEIFEKGVAGLSDFRLVGGVALKGGLKEPFEALASEGVFDDGGCVEKSFWKRVAVASSWASLLLGMSAMSFSRSFPHNG